MFNKHIGYLLIIIAVVPVTLGCTRNRDDDFSQVPVPDNLSADNADITITGMIEKGPVYLDQDSVMKYPQSSFRTYDPWEEKEFLYTGVSLLKLLESFGLDPDAKKIEVRAANDYTVRISISDVKQYEYILAYQLDSTRLGTGEEFAKMGKFIIAINFTDNRKLDVEVYRNQLVWQVTHIEVMR